MFSLLVDLINWKNDMIGVVQVLYAFNELCSICLIHLLSICLLICVIQILKAAPPVLPYKGNVGLRNDDC